MTSLARRHRARMAAAALTASTPSNTAPPMDPNADGFAEYNQLLVVLHDNLRAISDVQSIEARLPLKREFLPTFAPWVTGVLAAGDEGQAMQDEIVAWMFVWLCDLGEWDGAFTLANHILKFGLTMPDRWQRPDRKTNPGTFLADCMGDQAKADANAIPASEFFTALTLLDHHKADMPDQARAKLHRALGLVLAAEAEGYDAEDENVAGLLPALLTDAVDHMKRAVKLDQNVGIKKQLQAAEKALAKFTAAKPAPDPAQNEE